MSMPTPVPDIPDPNPPSPQPVPTDPAPYPPDPIAPPSPFDPPANSRFASSPVATVSCGRPQEPQDVHSTRGINWS